MLPTPLDLNREHLELLYRALGRGLVVYQYVEGTLYLLRSLPPKSARWSAPSSSMVYLDRAAGYI